MNLAEAARLHVQSLLARGVAMEGAGELGITGASEIWGGVTPRDKAGWYVWLRDRPGAYGLDLEGAERDGLPGEPVVRAQLSIRYYPSRDEPAFRAFSREERETATGGWLDATGAPDVLRAASIRPALFLIGVLELVFDGSGATRIVSVGAPERMGHVPAWELATPVLRALGGVVAQVERRSARRLVEATDVSHRIALLAFDGAACACGQPPAPLLDPDLRVLRDLALDGPIVDEEARGAPGAGLPVARGWFVTGDAAPARLGCCR